MEIKTANAAQTRKAGRELAGEVVKKRLGNEAFVLALEGNLGSGKTTFLQGFARGLGIKEKITSPTFVIMRRFQVSGFRFQNFYHFDCYRIEKPKELLGLGFKKIISNPANIVALEWASKAKKILPSNVVQVNFKFLDKNKRRIVIR